MSKNLTPLEAVKCLRNFFGESFYKYEFDIIETALKRLEEIDKRDSVVGIIEEKPLDVVLKKLKALEIIKECFGVNLILFTAEEFGLPKEKIDLLREVLCSEN